MKFEPINPAKTLANGTAVFTPEKQWGARIQAALSNLRSTFPVPVAGRDLRSSSCLGTL